MFTIFTRSIAIEKAKPKEKVNGDSGDFASSVPVQTIEGLIDQLDRYIKDCRTCRNQLKSMARRLDQAEAFSEVICVYVQQLTLSQSCDLGKDSMSSVSLLQDLIREHVRIINAYTPLRGRSYRLSKLSNDILECIRLNDAPVSGSFR